MKKFTVVETNMIEETTLASAIVFQEMKAVVTTYTKEIAVEKFKQEGNLMRFVYRYISSIQNENSKKAWACVRQLKAHINDDEILNEVLKIEGIKKGYVDKETGNFIKTKKAANVSCMIEMCIEELKEIGYLVETRNNGWYIREFKIVK